MPGWLFCAPLFGLPSSCADDQAAVFHPLVRRVARQKSYVRWGAASPLLVHSRGQFIPQPSMNCKTLVLARICSLARAQSTVPIRNTLHRPTVLISLGLPRGLAAAASLHHRIVRVLASWTASAGAQEAVEGVLGRAFCQRPMSNHGRAKCGLRCLKKDWQLPGERPCLKTALWNRRAGLRPSGNGRPFCRLSCSVCRSVPHQRSCRKPRLRNPGLFPQFVPRWLAQKMLSPLESWWRREELNLRHADYETAALPLSYAATVR